MVQYITHVNIQTRTHAHTHNILFIITEFELVDSNEVMDAGENSGNISPAPESLQTSCEFDDMTPAASTAASTYHSSMLHTPGSPSDPTSPSALADEFS